MNPHFVWRAAEGEHSLRERVRANQDQRGLFQHAASSRQMRRSIKVHAGIGTVERDNHRDRADLDEWE